MTACPYCYRIVGTTSADRRLVIAAAAFAGYASCDPKAEVDCEAYLSAFNYGDDFRARAAADVVVDTKGFQGNCWSPWIWWDIDRDGDLERALCDARRLAATLGERFGVGDNDLLAFFSGSKGFHLGLPTALWQPQPSATFNKVARRFAETTAEAAGVVVDGGVYDKVRAFRAPNSRHPKTGLYKRRLSLEQLTSYSLDLILDMAKHPAPFQLCECHGHSDQAAADWHAAAQHVERQAEARAQRSNAHNDAAQLNRLTLDFIRDGANMGDRHRLLFSAAANLAEFGCPPALAHALLTEAALDSGLKPSEVTRQIKCGLAAGVGGGARHG